MIMFSEAVNGYKMDSRDRYEVVCTKCKKKIYILCTLT